MGFESTAKVLAKYKLEYYRISEGAMYVSAGDGGHAQEAVILT